MVRRPLSRDGIRKLALLAIVLVLTASVQQSLAQVGAAPLRDPTLVQSAESPQRKLGKQYALFFATDKYADFGKLFAWMFVLPEHSTNSSRAAARSSAR